MFAYEQGEEFPPIISNDELLPSVSRGYRLVDVIKLLRSATSEGKFEKLRDPIPEGKVYLFGACGPEDMMPSELSFNGINQLLRERGKFVR